MDFLRVLLLADTHLGFERRGPDFFANFLTALQPALRGEVDVVVHGGDVFFRSRIPPSLVVQAFQPLAQVAARGVPVLVVPGNHERSHIPHPLLAVHRGVHIFDRPRTFVLPFACGPVAFSGFPYAHDVRARFPELLRETGPPARDAAVRLLCMHHAVEGARVGTPEFVFDRGPDVVRGRDLPAGSASCAGSMARCCRRRSSIRGRWNALRSPSASRPKASWCCGSGRVPPAAWSRARSGTRCRRSRCQP